MLWLSIHKWMDVVSFESSKLFIVVPHHCISLNCASVVVWTWPGWVIKAFPCAFPSHWEWGWGRPSHKGEGEGHTAWQVFEFERIPNSTHVWRICRSMWDDETGQGDWTVTTRDHSTKNQIDKIYININWVRLIFDFVIYWKTRGMPMYCEVKY